MERSKMVFKVYMQNSNYPIVSTEVDITNIGVWMYESPTKSVFYPFSSISHIIKEKEVIDD